jgi:hypothetical protein
MTPELSEQLAYLLALRARNPRAWGPHCLHRAKELAELYPSVYADLPRLLREAVSSLSQPSQVRPSTKGASDE